MALLVRTVAGTEYFTGSRGLARRQNGAAGWAFPTRCSGAPDRSRFYFGDSLQNCIWSYDYDAAGKTIRGEQPFFQDFELGSPDGSAMDTEGFLWNCRYGGSCVVRVAPNWKG